MPLFFLLGGLTFSTRGGFRAFLIRKVKTLLIPYYFFSLYFLAKPLAILLIPSLRTSFQTNHNYDIGHQFYDVLIAGNGLWFLMAFFVAEIIMYGFTQFVKAQVAQILVGLVLIITTFTLSAYGIATAVPFQIMLGIRISGFMLIGLAVRDELLHLSRTIASIIMIATIIIVVVSQTMISINLIDKQVDLVPYTTITVISALAGAFGFTCMAIIIQHCSWLAHIGRDSLVYYALNAITLNIIKFTVFRALHINATSLPYGIQLCIGLIATAFAVLLLTIENTIVQRWLWWSIGKKRP